MNSEKQALLPSYTEVSVVNDASCQTPPPTPLVKKVRCLLPLSSTPTPLNPSESSCECARTIKRFMLCRIVMFLISLLLVLAAVWSVLEDSESLLLKYASLGQLHSNNNNNNAASLAAAATPEWTVEIDVEVPIPDDRSLMDILFSPLQRSQFDAYSSSNNRNNNAVAHTSASAYDVVGGSVVAFVEERASPSDTAHAVAFDEMVMDMFQQIEQEATQIEKEIERELLRVTPSNTQQEVEEDVRDQFDIDELVREVDDFLKAQPEFSTRRYRQGNKRHQHN